MSLDFYLEKPQTVFEGNITHNLGEMASKAGIYEILWRPDEYRFHTAAEIIPILKHGIDKMKRNPEIYKELNPSNGWGDYEGLLTFCESVLSNCYNNPDAEIRISR